MTSPSGDRSQAEKVFGHHPAWVDRLGLVYRPTLPSTRAYARRATVLLFVAFLMTHISPELPLPIEGNSVVVRHESTVILYTILTVALRSIGNVVGFWLLAALIVVLVWMLGRQTLVFIMFVSVPLRWAAYALSVLILLAYHALWFVENFTVGGVSAVVVGLFTHVLWQLDFGEPLYRRLPAVIADMMRSAVLGLLTAALVLYGAYRMGYP